MRSIGLLRALRGAALVLLASAWIWACGGKVVIESGQGAGEGGAGGAGVSSSSAAQASSSSTSQSSAASTGTGVECTDEACEGLGTPVCSCVRTCGFAKLKAKCAPNEGGKLQCICSYEDTFSGACFETNDALLCNIDKGCCSKYFQGI